MSAFGTFSLIVAGAIAVFGLSWWAFSKRHRGIIASLTTPQSSGSKGELDGRADIPNNLTCVPFPTPAMEEIYEEGEQRRAELESRHGERLRNLEIRLEVLDRRAAELNQQMTDRTPRSGNTARRAAVIEESRAARGAAIEAEKKDHESRLAALDASTEMKVNQYWAANLRVRDRSTPDKTDLDTLAVPEPSQWRRFRQEERRSAGLSSHGAPPAAQPAKQGPEANGSGDKPAVREGSRQAGEDTRRYGQSPEPSAVAGLQSKSAGAKGD